MNLSTWIRSLHAAPRHSEPEKRRRRCRPIVESLECRTVPSTFWVANRNDSGVGSLRQAVLDANTHPGADVIQFRHAAEGTITLTSGELNITGDVRIDGPDADRQTVSSGGTSRVVEIASGVNVRIDDVTIANGSVLSDIGGGILNAGNLTLNESVVTGCTAHFSGGGGIANSGNLTVVRSMISNNYGGYGGGLLNTSGTVLFNHVTVSNNLGYQAGGIRIENGSTLTIQNSLITGNSAGDSPGTAGITSYFSNVNILNTTISENTGGNSAGLYLFGSGDCVISGSRIVHNSAPFGLVGGISDSLFSGQDHIRIEDTTISDNTGIGAGAFYDSSGSSTIEIVNSKISGNVATGGFAPGGLWTSASQFTLVDSTVNDNVGTVAGGIYSFGPVEITRSTISGNTAIPSASSYYDPLGGAAGGIVMSFGTINNSTISGNIVEADNMGPPPYLSPQARGAAGGILATFSGVTIDHSTIAFNSVINAPSVVEQVSGGVTGINFSVDIFGHHYESMANVSVRNTIIADNTATVREPDVTGSFVSQGHNLIGVLTAAATGFVASDLHGTMATPLDLRLEPLRNNGGPTKTHALHHNSPALNAGDNTNAPPTDQRGRTRIFGGTIDIGSFEAGFDSHGGEDDRMAVSLVNQNARKSIDAVVAALIGLPQGRSPSAGIAFNSDEQFGSRREFPTWLWEDLGGKSATSDGQIDSVVAGVPVHSRLGELDLQDAVFVGSIT